MLTLPARLRYILPAAIALLAPALGGCTEAWSQGVILLLIGALLFLQPPLSARRNGLFACLAAALLLVAAAGFLPMRFGPAPWRALLMEQGIPVSGTVSPEPWVSLHCWFLLFAGIGWIAWLSAQDWSVDERRRLIATLAGGVGLLGAVSLIVFKAGVKVPFWHPLQGSGPFPNRNQTANLFAIGGMLAVVCAFEEGRRLRLHKGIPMGKQAWRGVGVAAWLSVAGLLMAALVVNYSRSGPIILAGCLAAWFLVCALCFSTRSARRVAAAGTSLLLFLGAGLLLFGGETMRRFVNENAGLGFRAKIFSDTLALIHDSPWSGAGLGCFEGLFPLYRAASVLQERVLHPESDWLWLAAEAGWGAVLLALALLGQLARKAFPFAPGTGRRLRFAALTASVAFALHGLVDVSGHRLGACLPALLLLALSGNPGTSTVRNARPTWLWPVAFRLTGFCCAAFGTACLAAACLSLPFPGEIGARLLSRRAIQENAERHFAPARRDAGKALAWTPLDWRLHFTLGVADACDGRWLEALSDFRRARFLEPHFGALALEEGRLWLKLAPPFAIPAWEAGLQGIPGADRKAFYSNALSMGYPFPALREQLWELAGGDEELRIVYLRVARGSDFGYHLSTLLSSDPDLHAAGKDQQRQLFDLWVERGDGKGLAARFNAHPEWLANGWRSLIRYAEGAKDYATCLSTALRFVPSPVLPSPINLTRDEAKHRLLLNTGDISALLAIYEDDTRNHDGDAAVLTLEKIAGQPRCPPFVHYMEARELARAARWEEGWKAFRRYEAGEP